MMRSIFPHTGEEILNLSLEDLALFILKYLGAVENDNAAQQLNLNNFIIGIRDRWVDQEQVLRVFTEASGHACLQYTVRCPMPRLRGVFCTN